MKITAHQRNAASLYWTQILTGEIHCKRLPVSRQELSSFIVAMEVSNKRAYLQILNQVNPDWAFRFMNNLDKLLLDADDTLCLRLHYHPQGFLKQAAQMSEISEILFPKGALSMTFDNKGNIIVGEEVIKAKTFIGEAAQKISARL